MINTVLYRLWRLRRPLIIAALILPAAFAASAWIEGRYWRAELLEGSADVWSAYAIYVALVAATLTIWPTSGAAILKVVAAGAVVIAALPWLAGSTLLTEDASSLTLAIALISAFAGVWLVAFFLGRFRVSGPLTATASIHIDASPADVFDASLSAQSLEKSPAIEARRETPHGVELEYVNGHVLTYRGAADRKAGRIVTESRTSGVPDMRSVAKVDIAAVQSGSEVRYEEAQWNAPLGLIVSCWLGDIYRDYLRSLRDRIEGRPPASIRDRLHRAVARRR